LNDVAAAAYGMSALPASAFEVLQAGRAGRDGNVAVIAPGTGLGEATLYFDGRRDHAIASEGGHADFAPRTDVEVDLLRYLRQRHGHVSYERVLAGDGLFNIYSFLAVTRSHEHSIVIFKHSTTCGRSAMALQEVEDLVARDPSADVSMVSVQSASRVSNEIARRFGVRHESPQALIIDRGVVRWHGSHFRVNRPEIAAAL
jgi:bacillithiol system protein YtxJ